ncbi:PREDICTED: nitric oxide synthase, endothelial-like [Amphimedon queenslandica]|uniref:Nitric oxide synthase 1 n=1 Tax=Amphimedon queenslandica TaxID=400682 RepID=A0A1X7VJ38_AMPQE|nr:PREDICTED: nitric oxide synthase, endothelial-like [Amphimedon queenslandica]|eukprot:XP_011410183.2 PREDICTED: nitric oxide synthase, endothelial-like [Amphimedon queenslandica]
MSYDLIKVSKKPGESLGLGFNKNSERQNKVYAILEGTALQRSGEVRPGDLIVEVNGVDVSGYTSSQLIDIISTLQDKSEVSLKILRPDGSLSNGGTPAVSIDHPNNETPAPATTSRPNQRQRRKGGPLPQITETLDDGGKPGGLLQVKDHFASGKRHSLTPESSRREMVPLQPSKSLDLGALPTWRNKTFITLNNYVTGEQQTDRLHTQSKAVPKQTGCHPSHCVGSIIWPKEHPRSRPYGPPRPKEEMKELAKEYIKIYYDSLKFALSDDYEQKLQSRTLQVCQEIEEKGHYNLTYEELTYGARLAWRNAPRCVNRIIWRQLEVLDAREVDSAKEMFEALCDHLRYATNQGSIRSTITVFRHRTRANSDFRVWNSQLIRYAGYKQQDGSIIGDPDSVEFTEVCRKLGWSPPNNKPGMFDVLPLVLQANGEPPEMFTIPPELIMEVDIVHPEYKWFKDLKLKWYAVPGVSNILLDIGGLEFTGAPFNGWYMSTEIAARNFSDEYRYNLLKPVAERMGLNTSTYKLWKDRALVELNVAVLHSYQSAGVSIVDHHTATDGFSGFFKSESASRGGCPADWVWLVPPISGSVSKLFHQEMLLYYLTPAYEYQEPAYKYYHLPGDMPKLNTGRTFKALATMVLDATRMMRNVKKKRIKATVLYATETGRSKNYANIVKTLFDRTFNCSVYCMDEYNRANLEHEQLVLIVTSTFGSGDPPANGEPFGRYLLDLQSGRIIGAGGGTGTLPSRRNRVSVATRPSPEMLAKARTDMMQPLSQVKYAVFGLGSRAYPNFCAFAHTIDNLFLSLGAEQAYPCGEGDELCGQEESFQSWLRECYLRSCEVYKLEPRLEGSDCTVVKSEYKKDFFRISSFTEPVPTKDICRDLSHVHKKKIYAGTLVSRAKLQSSQSERNTILVVIKPQNHMNYQPGDHIAIYPQNNPSLVRQLLERLPLTSAIDEPIIIESQYEAEGGIKWNKERRLPFPVTLQEAFMYYLDITTPPTPQLLQQFQKMATRKLEQNFLEELGKGGDVYEDWKYERFPNLLEVMDQFHSLKLDVPFLLQNLPLLQCRYYSISSSPNAHPNEIHATIAVVTFRKRGGQGPRHYGVCSTWLNKMEPGSESIVPFVIRRTNSFHMPEDSHAPIIMVGPGTGIAPFRGFWQERMYQRSEELKKQLLSKAVPARAARVPRNQKGGRAVIPDTPANKISIGGGGMGQAGRRGFVSTVTAPVIKLLDVDSRPTQAPVSDIDDTESSSESESSDEEVKRDKQVQFKVPKTSGTFKLRRSASDEFQRKDLASLVAARDSHWGDMTLYFGCRRNDTDYIYREEIKRAQLTGAMNNVHVAFSREGPQKTYVQHLLKKNADTIVQQLIEERGHFYVCGDVSMAADVGRTLQNIFEENAAMSSDEARQLIESMKDNGYYHEDIFGVTLKTAEVTSRVRNAAKKAWRILVSAADHSPITPMSALSSRAPITPTTPGLLDTPQDGTLRLGGNRFSKRPTVTVLIPTPTQANEPTSPGNRTSFPSIFGKQSLGSSGMKKLGGGPSGYRSHLTATSFNEEDEEKESGVTLNITEITGDTLTTTNILGSTSPKTLKVPPPSFEQPPPPNLGPKSRPTSVQLRDNQDGGKRRAIRKIRSNSMVQTDV